MTQVDATVDKNPVMLGEYFMLTVTANDDVSSDALDTKALTKNFIVARTGVQHSTQIINFKSQKSTSWQIVLAAKDKGNFIIPALNIDNVHSQPINIKIVANTASSQQNQLAFVTSEVSHKTAYIGQLILFKVKLYISGEMQRGALSSPEVAHAQVKQMGEDQDSQDIVNGKRYRVIERTYGITPDQAGQLTLPAMSFQGDIAVNQQNSSQRLFGFGFDLNDSQMVQASSKPILINIKPKPANYQGQWLVADKLSVVDIWNENEKYQVGSPITRTITLLASNVEDNALADIAIPVPEGFKSYPEKAKRDSTLRNGQLISKLSQTIAMVPTKAGSFTLPAISIPWWNAKLNQQEFATLPEKTIQVSAAPQTETPPVIPPQVNSAVSTIQEKPVTVASTNIWPWVSALFALLWLVTLVLWLRGKKASQIQDPIKANSRKVKTRDISIIAKACEAQKPGQLLSAIQQYFTSLLNQPVTLQSVGQLDSKLKDIIDELQQAQYSAQPASVNYQQILSVIKNYQAPNIKAKTQDLSSLNP